MPGVSFLLPIWFDLAAVFLFALTGVWAATRRGYDIVGAFVLAFVAGVGGGLLRDVIVREEPLPLKPGQLYFLATLVGCIGFVVMSHHYGWEVEMSAWIAIGVTVLLRLLAIHLDWKTSAFGWRRP
jgi:uncharacterized membrane protein YeiH